MSYTHTHTHTYNHIQIHTHTYIPTHIHNHTNIHIHIPTHNHPHPRTVCVAHPHIPTHTYTHAHPHPHPLRTPTQECRQFSTTMTHHSQLLGLGNPLLDITVCADSEFLDRYGLQANNAIIARSELHRVNLFEDMQKVDSDTFSNGFL